MSRRNRDQGAALVTVLVMLGIIATLAVAVVEVADFALRRTGNAAKMDQVRWYVLGAEAYAGSRIADLQQRAHEAPGTMDQADWQGRPIRYPVGGGTMTLTLWDGSNCLNLNSVGGDGEITGAAFGRVQLARLFDLLAVKAGVGAAGLVAALGDWIDADTTPGPGGAEDDFYAAKGARYRTANTFLGDVSELRRIAGFDDAAIAKIAPYVCVRPTRAVNPINVDAIRPDQAALLSAMVGPDLSLESAQSVIADRPRGGYRRLEDFFADPRIRSLSLSEQLRAMFTERSQYFVLVTRVDLGDVRESAVSLIDATGTPHVVRRVFGVGAAGRLL